MPLSIASHWFGTKLRLCGYKNSTYQPYTDTEAVGLFKKLFKSIWFLTICGGIMTSLIESLISKVIFPPSIFAPLGKKRASSSKTFHPYASRTMELGKKAITEYFCLNCK